ncbi:uncharacterized protein TNCV_2693201 [Trichonephila clavipes]|uniref:Uncharacterized protein n=1 Tax=Trichonephila clavipes TaxID=2585209 RepID=A0A8X7BBX5_TRICX|nr:uncharacterized protein TNCV_2693201 [Trichonephila clavipes]
MKKPLNMRKTAARRVPHQLPEEQKSLCTGRHPPRDTSVKAMHFCGVLVPFMRLAAAAEWYRYRIVACLVTSSIPVPLKARHVGQRCTLSLPRAQTSSHWGGVVVRREGASSSVVHVT